MASPAAIALKLSKIHLKPISSQSSRLPISANPDFHVYGSLKKLFLSFLLNYFQVVRKMFPTSSSSPPRDSETNTQIM